MATGFVATHGTAHAQRAWRTPGESDAATARRLASMGRCDQALAPFDAAIESRAEDASLRRDRGSCHDRLNNPAPAIEDYRAYLSMDPTAPDATSIRTRLDALEATEPAASGGAPSATGATPEADRETASAKPKRSEGLPEAGDFTVALHLAAHAWTEKGYAVPTVAYGLAAAYAYAPALELGARLVMLRTNVLHTSGFGAGVDNTIKIGLDSARRWELAVALGLGVESQSNDLRIPRMYFFMHGNPKLRFWVSGPIMLEAGPEFGMGMMEQAEVLPSGDAPAALTGFYGGYFRLGWVIRGS
jgi:hypothetical protein